jgi:hypothetical protein
MYDVIDLIEQCASEPVLASGDSIAARAQAAGLAPGVVGALANGDAVALAHALGTRAEIVCMIMTPEPDSPQREDRPDPDQQPTPDDDNKPDAPRPTG